MPSEVQMWTIYALLVALFNVCHAQSWQRTVVFISRPTAVGENVFMRGGISDTIRPGCVNVAASDPCALPIRHRITPSDTSSSYSRWSAGDAHLDWYGNQSGQGSYQGVNAQGTPLMWTTSSSPGPGDPTVDVDGHGHTPMNRFGDHYWMLDVDMDCSKTENGWFEFKLYVTPLQGWEGNIAQYNKCPGIPSLTKPYTSVNHLGRCGKMNLFYANEPECNMFNIPASPANPPPSGCGQRRMFEDGTLETHIVGGNPATIGRWPWQGVLQYSDTIGGCAGVLIDRNWALTAAHCVRGTNPAILQIRFGEQNLQVTQRNEQAIPVSTITIHDRYFNPEPNDVEGDFDVALLRLSVSADLSQYTVNTVCLPSGFGIDDFVGANCWATGFGSTLGVSETYRLNEISIPVWQHSDCLNYWTSQYISTRQVCMGDGVKSACGGDSGGPLVCNVNNRWVLVGTTSWGDSSCQGAPSVYMRTTEFLAWITSVTGIPTI